MSGYIFLKNEEIKEEFKAKGIKKAKKELNIMKLADPELYEYQAYMENFRHGASIAKSNYDAGKLEGEEKGKLEGKRNKAFEMARASLKEGLSVDLIAKLTGLSTQEIANL